MSNDGAGEALPQHDVRVVICTLGSPQSGLGHLRRCLALACALQHLCGVVDFWVEDIEAVSVIRNAGFAARLVDPETLPEPGIADMLVVDGYHYDDQFIKKARDRVSLVLAIEDLPDRFLPAHIILNSGTRAKQPTQLYPSDTQFLLGADYALLDSAFSESPSREYRTEVHRILITVGGSDPMNLMPRLMQWVRQSHPKVSQDVIVGPFFSNQEEIEEVAQSLGSIKLWTNPTNMRGIMCEADLAVAGAGHTLFQLAACATPTVAIALFANQLIHVKELAQSGAVEWVARWSDNNLGDRVLTAVARFSRVSTRSSLGRAARKNVDGRGAQRVAAVAVERLRREQTYD